MCLQNRTLSRGSEPAPLEHETRSPVNHPHSSWHSPFFIVSIIHRPNCRINEDCNFTHETLVSLEMKNGAVGSFSLDAAGRWALLVLNWPICTQAFRSSLWFLGSRDTFSTDPHFWSSHLPLTGRDPLRPFILGSLVGFYWLALIQHKMKDELTLEDESWFIDTSAPFAKLSHLSVTVIHIYIQWRHIKAKAKPQRDNPLISR